MQQNTARRGGMVIIFTMLIAMLMNIMPLPDMIAILKPDWVAIVLIYWVMALPNRVGVFSGWILGLFVDVLEGSLFGINALSLGVVAFLIQMIYHRLRIFPMWKQAINVAVIVGIHRLIVITLSGFVTPVVSNYTYWLQLLSVALLWPWVFILLRDVRRKFCQV